MQEHLNGNTKHPGANSNEHNKLQTANTLASMATQLACVMKSDVCMDGSELS
jgi:hypothetical protein